MKPTTYLFTLLLLMAFSFSSFSQTKGSTSTIDSTTYMNLLRSDIADVQKYIYGKVTPEEYDRIREAFLLLINYSSDKRRKTKTQ